jgi:hypothetical protein
MKSKNLYQRTCLECGNSFETNRVDKLFDTNECRIDYNNRKNYKNVQSDKSNSIKSERIERSVYEFIESIVNQQFKPGEQQRLYTHQLTERFNEIYQRNKELD